jgi:hypothetical protein
MPWNPQALDMLGLNTELELNQLMAECYAHTEFFAKTFFPHIFFRPWSELHLELCSLLDDDKKQKVAIAAPRGFGKTSLFNLAFPAKRILFQDSRYIIPVSSTSSSAVEQADDLKSELVENKLIRVLFGDLQPTERKDPFGQQEWVTSNGCKVSPRGAGQQIRGRKYRSNRPDLYPVDDLENDEAVESEEQRDKLKRWFFSALVNSVDRGSRAWRIIVIGTILHEDSLLNNLLRDPYWDSVRFELCDDEYKSNWPDYMSDAEVQALAEEYRAKGLLGVFYREFRNIPIALEEQGFREEYFQTYKDMPEFWKQFKSSDLETVIMTDPARTMKDGSANTAVVAVTVNRRQGTIYLRDIITGKLSPDKQIEAMFDLAERYNAIALAPEVSGLHEYITWPIRNEMERRGRHYILIEVKPRQGKTGPKRSAGLIPLYRKHMIWHEDSCAGKIEKYLLQWPRPERWDEIDAFSTIIAALEDGERYLGTYDDEDEDPGVIEAEYDELEYDADELVPLEATVI